MITRPSNPPRSIRTRSSVLKLRIKQRAQRKIPNPQRPPSRFNQPAQKRLHKNRSRTLLPWPAQKRPRGPVSGRRQVHRGGDGAVVEGGAGVLVNVGSALRRHGVELAGHWQAWVYVAVLQHGGGVAEDEVYGTVDVAFPVELAEGERV